MPSVQMISPHNFISRDSRCESVVGTKESTTVQATMSTPSCKKEVLLIALKVEVVSMNMKKNVRCLLDCGSQRCRKTHHVPGDSPRVVVPSGAQLSGQKKSTTKVKPNPTSSALKDVTTGLECMDITQDTTSDSPSSLFPEITETIVETIVADDLLAHSTFLIHHGPTSRNNNNKRRRQSPPQSKTKLNSSETALKNSFNELTDSDSDDFAETATNTNPTPNTHQFPKLTQKQRKTIKNTTPNKTLINKKPSNTNQTNPKLSDNKTSNPTAITNPNVRPIMIMKPADIHSFMKKINTDLKVKITCKLTTQYLKLEPKSETLRTTITKYLDSTNVPYYLITPKISDPSKLSFVDFLLILT
ncbi:hypothetical protein CEXT_395871 [Caerostris extrusa]|uniref:Uncharacterized protein n=1 Tax=Caerostris extrusa TaxID=172846 RepID=A0AAV4P072_CAEEX|nr:hypothetical protein CEXT_395871 [Caerostris extrusa]